LNIVALIINYQYAFVDVHLVHFIILVATLYLVQILDVRNLVLPIDKLRKLIGHPFELEVEFGEQFYYSNVHVFLYLISLL
jgi:hypothetical protein